jgi:hypothetical protein
VLVEMVNQHEKTLNAHVMFLASVDIFESKKIGYLSQIGVQRISKRKKKE